MQHELQRAYPLHWAVWVDDVEMLKTAFDDNPELDIDKLDCRGRTALMLSVTLGRRECSLELLRRGANADVQNREMWSVSHEAISYGDERVLKEVIQRRDHQRAVRAASSMRTHLDRLKESPDFYAEMSWEFASWVPFVSKMCPSDTYKIYKSGSSVRIDTTLVGFEGTSWQRGDQSFIFRLENDTVPQIIVVDHQTQTATIQTLYENEILEDFEPPEEALSFRMRTPISTTFIDIEKIGFERSKGGLLSWIGSAEKSEKVHGYDCKVFTASNVDLVTKTRTEHLSEEAKSTFKKEESSNPLASLLNLVRSENEEVTPQGVPIDGNLLAHEYLDPEFKLDHDIGKPRQVTKKSNSFKATLWLAEDYPLNLQDQVAPIVDLMASSSAHFARLHNFIRLQLPSGFPAKIEIPLFHVLSAKITFSRINEPGPCVNPITSSKVASVDGVPTVSSTPAVSIEKKIFEIPPDYRTLDDSWIASPRFHEDYGTLRAPRQTPGYAAYSHPTPEQQEEMLLQMAIEHSLNESTTATGSTAPEGNGGQQRRQALSFDDEERMIALAIERSLMDVAGTSSSGEEPFPRNTTTTPTSEDHLHAINAVSMQVPRLANPPPPQGQGELDEEEELALALSLSANEAAARDAEFRDEDEALRRVLELSLIEK